MVEGWSKNLALLFPHALALAVWRLIDLALLLLPIVLIPMEYRPMWQKVVVIVIWCRTVFRFYSRVRKSNFSAFDCALSPVALPLFVYLLVRSWMQHHLFHRVAWKGRQLRVMK
jgi:hypothetical protein